MVDTEKINQAIELLREAANPKKIILFGSYATGRADEGSDLDLLVVEDRVSDVSGEVVRLLRVLSPLRIPVDVVVTSIADYEYWLDTPGNLMFEATSMGKVVYEAA